MVTVSSAQPSPPKSIFGMSQCTSDSDGFVTVGCLARGFSPADSLTFKWKDTKKELSEFVQYPAFGRDGDYTKISHMRIRKSDWGPQNPYTCQATNSKGSVEAKVQAKRVSKPTITLLSREDGGRIELQCQLSDYFPDKLTVQWLEGDKSVEGQIDKKFQNTDKGEKNYTYISQLSISAPYEEKKYTCKATHNSEEIKTEYDTCKAKSLSKPSVQIKKSHLRDVIQENKVTISCVVEAPDNTKVSWLVNGTSKHSTTEHKDLSINNIVSNLTLTGEEFTHSTIVCTAKHPCFPEEKDEFKAVPPPNQRATMYLTVPTKMELDNGTATFMCLAQQFSPKDYAFKWFQDDNAVTDAIDKYDKSEKNASVTMYSATSILQIKAEKWKTHSKVKCVFEHKAGNEVIEVENTDSCDNVADIVPHIVPPSVEDMLKNREGWLKCKASAQTPGFQKITIKADNKVIAKISEENLENKPDVELNAPIGYEEWSNGTEFTCTAEHSQLAEPKTVTFTRENGKMKRPSVYTLAPPEHKEGETMTLTCYVKDFFPKEVFVSWLADDQPVVNLGYSYNTSLPIKNDQDYSVYSQLTVIDSEWKSGTVFSCVVYHETVDEKLRVLTRSINDNTDKAGVINLSMNTPASCKD